MRNFIQSDFFKYIVWFLFSIAAIAASGQDRYSIPTIVFDSMAYEVQKGRACDSLQEAQKDKIKVQGDMLLQQGKAIDLQGRELDASRFIVSTWSDKYQKSEVLHSKEQSRLKTQIKRLWKVVVIEGGIILVLLI